MSLQLRKLDLHVHSPASHDFNDKSVTAKQIVEHCQKIGLDAIAITDHNTVDFIDIAKKAALEKGFTIFPGIEISCGGSKNGSIHIIGIFDPSSSKDDLQKIIGKLEIKGKGEDALTNKSISDVIDILKVNGGLPVLAHANSSHGALSDITGNPRTNIVQNPNLCAAEATASDFKKPEGKRLLDFLNGKDKVYKRQLPVYKSSDNRSPEGTGHCLESIGSGFTFFKMGELTIESLRQCFEDPDTRIIQDYELEKIHSDHPTIQQMIISGGYLNKQQFDFHSNMNSIIGGTGTGKSLAIEFLRFVLGLKPQGVLFKDHSEKLQKQLSLSSEIKITIQDKSGDLYEVSRKYGSVRDPYSSEIVCINKTKGKKYVGSIQSIFPVLIYSQTEILEITRDTNAQMKLLDNFRNFEDFKIDVQNIETQLEGLDRKLIQAIQDSKELSTFQKQLTTIEEKIDKLQKGLSKDNKSGIAESFHKLSEVRELIVEKIEEFDDLKSTIDDTIEELQSNNPTKKKDPKETIDIVETKIGLSYDAVIKALKDSKKIVDKNEIKSKTSLTVWENKIKYKELEKAYEKQVKERKKEEVLETQRKDLLRGKKALLGKIEKSQKATNLYEKIRKERINLLNQLITTKDNYFDERKNQADLINQKSGGKLQIVIQPGDNKSNYSEMLNKLKVGSQAEKREIEEIIRTITPIDLIEKVLDGDVKKFASACKVSEIKADNIIKELTSYENLTEGLAMQYKGYPEDLIQINYQKKDGALYPLSELSMGQKADALIMIALGDGEMPVIIDQPEDALDIPSIWEDICTRLRINKHSRQFIFTTHNSSISVSADSDQFIVLEADGKKGWIARSGSIDERDIKNDVVGHLEGGYSAYKLKRKKYDL